MWNKLTIEFKHMRVYTARTLSQLIYNSNATNFKESIWQPRIVVFTHCNFGSVLLTSQSYYELSIKY